MNIKPTIKKVMDKKERFQQAKAIVVKYFPQAITQIDNSGKFFVAQNGVDICNKEINKSTKKENNIDDMELISKTQHYNSVLEAWVAAESLILSNREFRKANKSISDEEIIKAPLEE
jgi:hypothetical protein